MLPFSMRPPQRVLRIAMLLCFAFGFFSCYQVPSLDDVREDMPQTDLHGWDLVSGSPVPIIGLCTGLDDQLYWFGENFGVYRYTETTGFYNDRLVSSSNRSYYNKNTRYYFDANSDGAILLASSSGDLSIYRNQISESFDIKVNSATVVSLFNYKTGMYVTEEVFDYDIVVANIDGMMYNFENQLLLSYKDKVYIQSTIDFEESCVYFVEFQGFPWNYSVDDQSWYSYYNNTDNSISIFRTNSGIYFTQDGNVLKLDRSGSFTALSNTNTYSIKALTESVDGQLFAISDNGRVIEYRNDSWTPIDIDIIESANQSYSSTDYITTSVEFDLDGNMWIGANNGRLIKEISDGTFEDVSVYIEYSRNTYNNYKVKLKCTDDGKMIVFSGQNIYMHTPNN